MKDILITGADGFIGRHMTELVDLSGGRVRAACRQGDKGRGLSPDSSTKTVYWDLEDRGAGYRGLLEGIECVIHLAYRRHIPGKTGDQQELRNINVTGTRALAESAAEMGVKRFIFVSSIKVNGEHTWYRDDNNYGKFSETDLPNPVDVYGADKYSAEQEVIRTCRDSAMEYVILRPPLVYGPGVKGNFLRLLRLVKLGLPLPLGSVKNLRSLIYVRNLCDATIKCIHHPRAANQVYLLSDNNISINRLIREMAAYMNKNAAIFPFPPDWLNYIGRVTGKKNFMDRMTGSLVIDNQKITIDLGWTPPCAFAAGLKSTVEWYTGLSH